MEDILASIRRIIADDQLQANRPAAASGRRSSAAPSQPAKAERAAEYGEVLDLSRMANTSLPEPAQAARAEPAPAYRGAGSPQDAGAHYDAQGAAPARPAAAVPQPIYSNGYATPTLVREPETPFAPDEPAPSPSDRFQVPDNQPQSYYVDDEPEPDDPLMSPGLGGTVMSAFETLAATVVLQNSDMLDRVMRDLMRPLIKTWLDENLPTLVERLVRGEIERMARGGRG